MPCSVSGRRETIVTSPIAAIPQYIVTIPGPSIWHWLAAIGTAGFFLSLTVKLVPLALAFAVLAIYSIWRWMWEIEGEPGPDVDIGGGLKLPVYATGLKNHGNWATWVLIVVLGMIFVVSASAPEEGSARQAGGAALVLGGTLLVLGAVTVFRGVRGYCPAKQRLQEMREQRVALPPPGSTSMMYCEKVSANPVIGRAMIQARVSLQCGR